jgi:hypothetical protein
MPDITVTFTDAQWARVVAASSNIIPVDQGTIDADKLSALFKKLSTSWVKQYERRNASLDDF